MENLFYKIGQIIQVATFVLSALFIIMLVIHLVINANLAQI